jgi:uncharacterized protein DUF4169
MGKTINLRTARKAAARRQAAERAAENRVIHGRTKAERQLQAAKSTQAAQHLDGHRLDTGDDQ